MNFVKSNFWPFVIGAVVSLVLFWGVLGWLVPASNVQAAADNAVFEHQVGVCIKLANADPEKAAAVDYNKRRKLAEKHALMPGDTTPDSKVVNACTSKLTS